MRFILALILILSFGCEKLRPDTNQVFVITHHSITGEKIGEWESRHIILHWRDTITFFDTSGNKVDITGGIINLTRKRLEQ